MAQLTESAAAAARAQGEAEASLAATRDKLHKREARVVSLSQEKAELDTAVRDAEAEVQRLKKRGDKARLERKDGEERLAGARKECERLGGEVRGAREALAKCEEALAEARGSGEAARGALEAAQGDLAAVRTLCENRGGAMALLEEAVAASAARVEEQRSDYANAVRLVKGLNKELQAGLRVEVAKVARLERELALAERRAAAAAAGGGGGGGSSGSSGSGSSSSAAAAAASPGVRPQLQSGAFLPQSPAVAGLSALSPGGGGGGARGAAAPSASASAAPPGSAARAGGAGSALAPTDLQETVKALGLRLQSVLRESEESREKCKMLEGIVQSLSLELEEKKRVLKELTSSAPVTVGGAGSGSASVPVLTSLLEKAQQENERLKRDLRTLGAAAGAGAGAGAGAEAGGGGGSSSAASSPGAGARGEGSSGGGGGAGGRGEGGNPFGAPAAAGNPFGGSGSGGGEAAPPPRSRQGSSSPVPSEQAGGNPF